MYQVVRTEAFTLRHAQEGSTWKKHKYIRIENGRYIYPEDVAKTDRQQSTTTNVARAGNPYSKIDPDHRGDYKFGAYDALKETRSQTSPEVQDALRVALTNNVFDGKDYNGNPLYDSYKSEKMESRIMKNTGCSEEDVKNLNKSALEKGFTSKSYQKMCNDLAGGDPEKYRKVTSAMKRQVMGEILDEKDENVDKMIKMWDDSGGDFDSFKKKAWEFRDDWDEATLKMFTDVRETPPMHPDVMKKRKSKKNKQLKKAQLELYGKKGMEAIKARKKAQSEATSSQPEQKSTVKAVKPNDTRQTDTGTSGRSKPTRSIAKPNDTRQTDTGTGGKAKSKPTTSKVAKPSDARKTDTGTGGRSKSKPTASKVTKPNDTRKTDTGTGGGAAGKIRARRADAVRNTVKKTVEAATKSINKDTRQKVTNAINRTRKETANKLYESVTKATKKQKPRTITMDDLISIFSGRG